MKIRFTNNKKILLRAPINIVSQHYQTAIYCLHMYHVVFLLFIWVQHENVVYLYNLYVRGATSFIN